ncbi:MAG: sugar ABC transporter substrate-binding protein [Longimicrobiales bacterium]
MMAGRSRGPARDLATLGAAALGLAASALALATLTACGGASGQDQVVLEFWAMGREGEVVQELVREFERENPGIRVEVQQMPWTAAHEKLLTAFVGRATPDLAQLGNTWVPEFAAIGAIESLDARIARSGLVKPEAYFPGIWETNVVAGATYGIPWYVDTRLLFYRTDLFARAGWNELPRTWDELLEAMGDVKHLQGRGGWPIVLPTDEWDKLIVWALAAGAPLLDDDGTHGRFQGPRFRRAFEFWLGLFRDGLAPPYTRVQVANRYQQFADGEFAMVLTGPWDIGEFRRRLPAELQDDWTTAPMPAPGDAAGAWPGASLAGGSSLVLFDGSEHPHAAWKLIEFLSRPEQQLRFYELTGDLPARRAAWQDPALLEDPQINAFYVQLQNVAPLPQVPEIEEIVNRVAEFAEAVALGGMDSDEALAALDAEIDRILTKRRWMLARRPQAAGTAPDPARP